MNSPTLPTPAPIPDFVPYVVTDIRTGQIVYETTYKNRNRARRWADRKDLEWGAVRYVAGLKKLSPLPSSTSNSPTLP